MINYIHEILKQAVIASMPTGKKYEQLQTFAVLRDKNDVNTENLHKNMSDRHKPYFYSRKWEQLGYNPSALDFEYPALFVFELRGSAKNILTNKEEDCYQISIDCVYPNVENAEDTNYQNIYKVLNPNDIYRITSRLLKSAIHYMKGIEFVFTDDGILPLHKNYIQQENQNGVTYIIDRKTTKEFQSRLVRNNSEVSMEFIDDYGKDKLCGVSAVMNFCFPDCPTFEYKHDAVKCCVEQDQ